MRNDRTQGTSKRRQLFLKLPFMPLAFYYMIACYSMCGWITHRRSMVVESRGALELGLDAAIPFTPYLLPLYLSFFSFWLLPKALLPLGGGQSAVYREVNITLMLMTLISCGCFLLFPMEVALRDQALAELSRGTWPDWLARACYGLYAVDLPYNAWPSIHVSQPLLIMLVVSSRRLFTAWHRALLWCYLAIVASSVLLMKQHYLWDVVSGVALALLTWSLWLRPRIVPVPSPPSRRFAMRAWR
jgi:hypothetical protein